MLRRAELGAADDALSFLAGPAGLSHSQLLPWSRRVSEREPVPAGTQVPPSTGPKLTARC